MADNFSVFIQTLKVFEEILFLTRMICEMLIGNTLFQERTYMNRILRRTNSFFCCDVNFLNILSIS